MRLLMGFPTGKQIACRRNPHYITDLFTRFDDWGRPRRLP